MASAALDQAARRAYDRMAGDLRRVFGDRFVALVASDRGSSAAFVSTLDASDLDALGPLADAWHREQLSAPLVMTVDEFHRSLDAFPAEYQTLLDHHDVITGRPPFDGVRIHADDLRRACEVQARGHLIHLRQGWIEAASHHGGLAALIERSAGPLRALLANIASVYGEHPADDMALAGFAHRVTGMPEDLVRDVLAVTDAPQKTAALVPALPDYLAACQRLWVFIDRWRAQ